MNFDYVIHFCILILNDFIVLHLHLSSVNSFQRWRNETLNLKFEKLSVITSSCVFECFTKCKAICTAMLCICYWKRLKIDCESLFLSLNWGRMSSQNFRIDLWFKCTFCDFFYYNSLSRKKIPLLLPAQIRTAFSINVMTITKIPEFTQSNDLQPKSRNYFFKNALNQLIAFLHFGLFIGTHSPIFSGDNANVMPWKSYK